MNYVYTLKNGLRLVVDPLPGLKSFALTLIILGGSRYETPKTSGWAHLLEHMVFKGAAGRSARAIAEAIEHRGGSINASTGYEHTRFEIRGLLSLLPEAITLLSDMVYRSHFDSDDLEREKKVVEQEILEAYDTPDDYLFDRLQMVMFKDHALGRPILGTAKSLKTVRSDTIKAFSKTLYCPQRCVIAISGGVDPLVTQALISNAFGDVQYDAPIFETPKADFSTGSDRVERDIEQANIALAFQGLSRYDACLSHLRLYCEILGGGMASRLFQEAREEKGLAYTIDSFVTPYRDTGVLGIYAGCSPKDVTQLMGVISDILNSMPNSLDARDLDRAKAQYLTHLHINDEGCASRASSFASQMLTHDTLYDSETHAKQINSVTLDDIKAIAETFKYSVFAEAYVGPPQAQ